MNEPPGINTENHNLVSHLVLIIEITCPQPYKRTNKQGSKHTPYWEDKSPRPYGATKKHSLLNGAKDGLKSVKCEQTLSYTLNHNYL